MECGCLPHIKHRLDPPYFEKVLSMAAGRGEIPNILTFSIPRGGQSRTLTFFLNRSLTGQHLANSGEAQLKKSPCRLFLLSIVPVLGNVGFCFCFAHPPFKILQKRF